MVQTWGKYLVEYRMSALETVLASNSVYSFAMKKHSLVLGTALLKVI